MNKSDLEAIMAGIGPVLREFTQREIEAATAPLLRRIAELEAVPYLREAGVWSADTSFGVGAVVTDRGSAWVCKEPTMARPGESADWRLLVKKGRDGRDRRDIP